jgi:predicted ATPase/DNA-binding SARP family transcriptional activator
VSTVRLSLLGPPRLERDGKPVELDTRKTVALVTYLAMAGQSPGGETHSREALATLLWPELEPQRARANLRRSLSVLRKGIGGEWLVADRETIGTHPEAGIWLDVAHFRCLLNSPQTHSHPEAETCPDCLEALAEAVDLYQGDFLEGFSLRDSANFDEWQFFQTEGLRQELAQALERLVHGYSAQGAYEQAIPYGRRWVALDPLHEPAHRQLMQLYALAGQRAAALRQYTECARILEAELGLPPAEETTSLYEQIRTSPAIGAEPVRPATRPRHNLPAQTTPFVGREAELEAIRARLREPGCRLLTVVGPGGVGKTRLALEAASSLIHQTEHDGFVDGVYFVRMAPLESAEALVTAVARALGFSFYSGAEGRAAPDPQQQLLDYLRQKRLLLLMDNFEHLLEGVELVAAMLAAAPHVKVLATSRARIGLQGEHLYTVSGMQFPDPVSPAAVEMQEVLAYSAVKLFMQTAQRVDPGFAPQPKEFMTIARICHLVEGMPLGILLAAAWVDMLPPREIAAEVERSLDFLATDLRDVPARQRSIRAAFEHSWNLLTKRERAVFQALSVFRGGFTREAAQQVASAELHELRSLASKSLVQPTSESRYEVHELLRQYAAEKLQALPDAATDIADRHCAYYTAALQRWESDLIGPKQSTTSVEAEEESGNIRTAWTWAVEQRQVERLDRAMEGLDHFYWHSGRLREAEAAFQAAAAAAGAAANEAATQGPDARANCLRVQARALAWQSHFQRLTAQWDAARQVQQKCLAILRDPALCGLDTRLERAVLSWSVGYTLVWMADYTQARQQMEECYSLFRALGLRWGMTWALYGLGITSMILGDYGEARRRLEEGLAINRALGNQQGVASFVSRLSGIACEEGRLEEAECLAREGVAASLEAGSRTRSALPLLKLGEVLEKVAKFSEAHCVLQQSLELYTDLGRRDFITIARSSLGSVALHLGRYEEARDQARTGLALAREHGSQYCIGPNLLLLGCLEVAQGVPATAHRLLEESAAVYREGRPKADLALALACLAIAARGLGDTPGARQHLCHALEIAQESRAVPPLMWALPATALLLEGEGENERAVELYALSSRFPLVAKSHWFADIVGNQIAAIAATLPPDVVRAAQARGQAQDLWATAAGLLEELSDLDQDKGPAPAEHLPPQG